MKKDIYIIKNDLNDLVYVGQAINSKVRFSQHCGNKKRGIFLDKQINILGKEHFWYEILESQIENYDERERYWIKYYNCIWPNGYNKLEGGQNATPLSGTKCPFANIQEEEMLENIYEDLKNSSLTLIEIANKYKVLPATISKINCGRTYKKENVNYPLRKEKIDCVINGKQILQVKKLLESSSLTFDEIAKLYNISSSYVGKINRGESWFDNKQNYPIRKGRSTNRHYSPETIDKIYELLINTRLSLRKIGEIVNVPYPTVQQIKNGTIKLYKKEEYTYPLRSNNFKKPVSTISAKESKTTIDT